MTVGTSRLAALLVLALAGTASAQSSAAADEAFRQGRELIKQQKWAEACEQFDKSQRLDPQLGTVFNIGQCSEHINRLATAIAAYRELVARDTKEERKAAAKERLAALEPRVPKVLVKVDNPPAGVTASLESKFGPRDIQINKPIEVDFGDYTIVVRARGHSEFISKVKITEERKTTTVDATMTPGASNSESVLGDGDSSPGSTRKWISYGAMGVGGAALVTGIVFGVLATSDWNKAKEVCGSTSCTTQEDVDRANELAGPARTKATLSTVFVISGALVAGAGVYLFLTLPGDVTVTPQASESGAGVTIHGRF